jgi:hypothetical protein
MRTPFGLKPWARALAGACGYGSIDAMDSYTHGLPTDPFAPWFRTCVARRGVVVFGLVLAAVADSSDIAGQRAADLKVTAAGRRRQPRHAQ